MTAVSLNGDGGGHGCVLLACCCGCRLPLWRKPEAAGTWTQTGSLRRSPCFQAARAGKASTPGGAFGNRCCTSGPDENERGTSMPLDKPGDAMARGQM